ncbi:MAG: glycerophosphoryl diester phosphodiesterase membrane domain-containing protein, partial [Bacilli bacterium]
MNKATKRIIPNTINNFSYNYRGMALFQVLYKTIALFLFIPLNYFILEDVMKRQGYTTVANNELFVFGLKPATLIAILLIAILSFISMSFEMATLTYIAKKSHERQ